jgi:hypothetical protein
MTPPAPATHRVLNLGAGTQSSVLLIMCDRGDLPPVEAAIFADTQAEPPDVYAHLDWLEKQVRNTRIVRVTHGNLRTAALAARVSKKSGRVWAKGLPYWTRREDGTLGLMGKRPCTVDYKITPVNRWIRQNLIPGRLLPTSPVVTRVFGISYDERERMTDSREAWAVNEYPLVERRWTRDKVIGLAKFWFPNRVFPRSACTFCPYHQNAEWRHIRDTMPDEWASAIAFDEAARALHARPDAAMRAEVFVHRSGVPLKLADLSEPEPETDLFGMRGECLGLCGV